MELVFRTSSEQKASKIHKLLEENGIPAFLTNENVNRLRHFGFHGIGVFVHINAQKDEAIYLINDTSYAVEYKVDIDEFYRQAKNIDTNEATNYLFDVMFKFLGVLLVFGVIIFLVATNQ
jgi:Xaa-Pro aminopeptidase